MKKMLNSIVLCWCVSIVSNSLFDFRLGAIVEASIPSSEPSRANQINGAIHQITAIEKGTAQLPCNLTSGSIDDQVVLVVWYKDEHVPIYSYDLRMPHTKNSPKHWRGENLETRAHFRTNQLDHLAHLTIDNVNLGDEGEYRCRIDFHRSATKNQRTKLNVIVPPQKPKILDENGKQASLFAGPYEEGGDVKLTCIVVGGKPPPIVQWYRSGDLLESTNIQSGFPDAHANQLVIRNLNRTHLHASLTCRTTNNNSSIPLQTTIKLELHFRPISVEILNGHSPLSAERNAELRCQTYGSRPAAQLTWLIEGKELKPPRYIFNTTEVDGGNSTISVLSFVPTRHENGLTLTCRALNAKFARNGIIETTTTLNIFYLPLPSLMLGSNLNPDDIEEGDDVYFECKVNSNPWAYKVIWKHNGHVMQHNQKAGVIMSSSDLALQGIAKNQMGNYSCVASNVEGDGESNIVNLKIMYKPLCQPTQKRLYGVGRHESAKVLCEVDSYPPPDSFKWAFNNSAETIDVPFTRYHSTHRFTSTLTYTPITDLDYGTVMCWANNLAGKQAEPCVFHIVTAGKPDPPFNCTISNMTNGNGDSLDIKCFEGFDGGVPQRFVLEIRDQDTDVSIGNLTSKVPIFSIYDLQTNKMLKLVIYSMNSKGRSDRNVIFEGYTLNNFAPTTVQLLGEQLELPPILGLLAGVVLIILIFLVTTLAYMKLRMFRRRRKQKPNRPSFLAKIEDDEKDEVNPDLIPTTNPANCRDDGEQQQLEVERILTPLTEAFLARNEEFNTLLDRPTNLAIPSFQNEGNARGSPSIISPSSTYLDSRNSQNFIALNKSNNNNSSNQNNREVVTIRAPLLGFQQESCV